ncbi:hypothetical protein PIB30_055232 [Stylosanthes scabra]|uniref:Ribonuclease H1 N-terminal domain-containing protein n=1 Tax=Stylosanthes scabra TaxID=79078 RepID=A0ABU6UHS9_9FABA|nr:hypothetical protein [Stylosanthes scabra]
MSQSPTTTAQTYKIYVVFIGWVPGIYNTMEEVGFQISEYEGAKWGEFSNLDEAEEAYLSFLGEGDKKLGIKLINDGDAPEPVETDDHRSKQTVALLALHERYHQEAKLPLPYFLPKPAMVPEKPQRRPNPTERSMQ